MVVPTASKKVNIHLQRETKYGYLHVLLNLHVGETVKVGIRGRVHAFPYDATCPTGPPRTCDIIKTSAEIAVAQEKPVGQKKSTVLVMYTVFCCQISMTRSYFTVHLYFMCAQVYISADLCHCNLCTVTMLQI